MIHLLAPAPQADACCIVRAALERSFTAAQVCVCGVAALDQGLGLQAARLVVLIAPPDEWLVPVQRLLGASPLKLLVLGATGPQWSQWLGLRRHALPAHWRESSRAPAASSGSHSRSALSIEWTADWPGLPSGLRERPFERFDFTDEWNNLGFGAIRADGSIWSLAQQAWPTADWKGQACAWVHGTADEEPSLFAARWDDMGESGARNAVLWINRAVGLVDSAEWIAVERFAADERADTLRCQPVLEEIPFGTSGAVTMRLDCDEDIASAGPLHDLYRRMNVPFSLAVHAKVLLDDPAPAHRERLQWVLQGGGAILSHTLTHAPDWGGSYMAALREGTESAAVIGQVVGVRPRHAVSPFHQTPVYARQALADAGYSACVGGIIRNDPDFLMARSGRPPRSVRGFIGHSQQCMLHGDCMLGKDDALGMFKQAHDIACATRTFFGYLDHPFSARYQYGWSDEASRLAAHTDWISYLRRRPGIVFANQSDALNFLLYRSLIDLHDHADRADTFVARMPSAPGSRSAGAPVLGLPAVRYRGECHDLSAWADPS